MVLTHSDPKMLDRVMLREYSVPACSPMMYRKLLFLVTWLGGWMVLLTRTLTSMGLSGLAKLSCTPAQHTGMLAVLSSVGGTVMSGGTSGRMERECRHVM